MQYFFLDYIYNLQNLVLISPENMGIGKSGEKFVRCVSHQYGGITASP
jgi:hypothetical protein